MKWRGGAVAGKVAHALLVVTALAAALWFFRVRLVDRVVFHGLLAVGFLTLADGVMFWAGMWRFKALLEGWKSLGGGELTCGEPARLELGVRRWWWPFFGASQTGWVSPDAEIRGDAVVVRERGLYQEVVVSYGFRDGLGLFDIARPCRFRWPLRVLPARKRLANPLPEIPPPSGSQIASASGSNTGDLGEIRNYREGESSRRIVYRVALRTDFQRLVVRTEEGACSPSRAFFFVPGAGDASGAELARMIVDGAEPGLRQFTGESWWLGCAGLQKRLAGKLAGPADVTKALDLIAFSASVREDIVSLKADFEAFLGQTRFLDMADACVISGMPPEESQDGAWLERVEQVGSWSTGRSLVLLVALPGERQLRPEQAQRIRGAGFYRVDALRLAPL